VKPGVWYIEQAHGLWAQYAIIPSVYNIMLAQFFSTQFRITFALY